MNFPAPGWVLALLSDVAEINPRLDKTDLDEGLEVSFVPMPAVGADNGVIDVSTRKPLREVRKGYTPFLEGDVLFAKITPCMENGKMAVVPKLVNGIGFGSTEFHVLRPGSGILASYLYYYVSSKQFRHDAEHNMTGAVGQKRVPTTYLAGCEIPLPPTNEQRRIVAKIEALFSELDKGIEALKTAREQLKVYRQAVLKHAFEGKLTARWREENRDKLESPEKLLARIQQERESRYQQQMEDWKAEVSAWERGGGAGKRPGKPRLPPEPKPVDISGLAGLPQLPHGWAYVRCGLLVDEPVYGTSKKCSYEADGRGVLRIPNVARGTIDASDLKFAEFDEDEVRTYSLREGDILIIRSNGSVSLVGQCALVRAQDVDFLYAGYLIRLRPNDAIVVPHYLIMAMSSHLVRKQIEAAAKSTSGVNNINSGEIQHLTVPLCSMGEQEEMVRQVSQIIDSIGVAEREVETQLSRSDILRQSILKKAFSGQLVPQDPNDEPAAALLERIRAEKAAQAKPAKSNRRKQPA